MKEIKRTSSSTEDINTMNYPEFFDSMFQLADVWTDSIDPLEYEKFLNMLFDAALVYDETTEK